MRESARDLAGAMLAEPRSRSRWIRRTHAFRRWRHDLFREAHCVPRQGSEDRLAAV